MSRAGLLRAIVLGGSLTVGVVAGADSGARVGPETPAVVVDAEGRLVGVVSTLRDYTDVDVLIRHGSVEVLVQMTDSGALRGSLAVGYEEAGCQGTAWLVRPGFGSFDPIPAALFTHSAVGPSGVVYVPGSTAATPVVSSFWGVVCNPVTAGPAPAVDPVSLVDLGAFSPPFRIR